MYSSIPLPLYYSKKFWLKRISDLARREKRKRKKVKDPWLGTYMKRDTIFTENKLFIDTCILCMIFFTWKVIKGFS